MIIKSGLLPREIQHDKFYDIATKKSISFQYKLKYFENITVSDLEVLESAIKQKIREVKRLHYSNAKILKNYLKKLKILTNLITELLFI